MYHQFVPQPLHTQAELLIAELNALSNPPEHCPYCQQSKLYTVNAKSGNYRCSACKKGFNRSVGTPYYRLAPLEWLPIIAERRLCGRNYAAIRYELDYCTSTVVKRRVNVIEQQMANRYPQLYHWYVGFIAAGKGDTPKTVMQEAEQLKNWLNNLLQGKNTACPHCQSDKIKKIGENRSRLRCQSCWRYFSNLKGTGLEHLQYSQHWLTMIDMLVAGETNKTISRKLKINANTTGKAKRIWLNIMEQRELMALKSWVETV